MPNDRTQSPSLEDQLRWKREMEVSQTLSLQKSPGFFPGPGAEAGVMPQGAGGAAGEIGSAAKDLLSGNASLTESLMKATGTASLSELKKVAWGDVPDVFDGTGFISLTGLQIYWIMVKLNVKGLPKMDIWEEPLLILLTGAELFLIIFVLTIFSVVVCTVSPSCAVKMWSNLSIGDVFSALKLF